MPIRVPGTPTPRYGNFDPSTRSGFVSPTGRNATATPLFERLSNNSDLPNEVRRSLRISETDPNRILFDAPIGASLAGRTVSGQITVEPTTGMAFVSQAGASHGGFAIQPYVDWEGNYTSAEGVLEQALGAPGGNVRTNTGLRDSPMAWLQRERSAQHVQFGRLNPVNLAQISNQVALPSTITDERTGRQPTRASNIISFISGKLQEVPELAGKRWSYRGQGNHLTWLDPFEAANYPVDEGGYFHGGSTAKRSQQQGVHMVDPIYSAPGVERERWKLPARFAGQSDSLEGYNIRQAVVFNPGGLLPEGGAFVREGFGLSGATYTTDIPEGAEIPFQQGDVYAFGRSRHRAFRGAPRTRGWDILPRSAPGSGIGLSIDAIGVNPDTGLRQVTYTRYVDAAQASFKLGGKDHGIPVRDSFFEAQGLGDVEIIRGAPGKAADIVPFARQALLSDPTVRDTDALRGRFARAARGLGITDPGAIDKLFQGGVIGGENTAIYDLMATDYLRENTQLRTFKGVRVTPSVIEAYSVYGDKDRPRERTGWRTDTFNGTPYQYLSNVRRDGDAFLADITTPVAILNHLERPRPEFERGQHLLREELLNNMALTRPQLYRNLLMRQNAGMIYNPQEQIIQSVSASASPRFAARLSRNAVSADEINIGKLDAELRKRGVIGEESNIEDSNMLYLQELARRYGSRAIKVDDKTFLPSFRALLSTTTRTPEGRLISPMANQVLNYFFADTKEQRADALSQALLRTAEYADLAQVREKATGMTLTTTGGPAIAYQGIGINEAVMSRQEYYERSGVYNVPGLLRPVAKAMAMRAYRRGEATVAATMFPHVDPENSWAMLGVTLTEDARRRPGLEGLSDVRGQMYVSTELAPYFRKDYDADTIFGFMSRVIGMGGRGPRWVGKRVAADSPAALEAVARRSEEWRGMMSRAGENIGDYMRQMGLATLKPTDTYVNEKGETVPVGSKSGLWTGDDLSSDAYGRKGYSSLAGSKAAVGGVYNWGQRSVMEYANALTIAAGGRDEGIMNAVAQVVAGGYQKGIDMEGVSDQALLGLLNLFRSGKVDWSRNPMTMAAGEMREGRPVGIGRNLDILSNEIIQRVANLGRTPGSDKGDPYKAYKEEMVPNLARGLLPQGLVRSAKGEEAVGAVAGILRSSAETGNVDIEEILRVTQRYKDDPELGRYARYSASQLVIGGSDRAEDQAVLPSHTFQSMLFNTMRTVQGITKDVAGGIPSGTNIQKLLADTKAAMQSRREKTTTGWLESVRGLPANVYAHTARALQRLGLGDLSEGLTEASMRSALGMETVETGGRKYNTLNIEGKNYILNPDLPLVGSGRVGTMIEASAWMGDYGPESLYSNPKDKEQAALSRKLSRLSALGVPRPLRDKMREELNAMVGYVSPYARGGRGKQSREEILETSSVLSRKGQLALLARTGQTPMTSEEAGQNDYESAKGGAGYSRDANYEIYMENKGRGAYGHADILLPFSDDTRIVGDVKAMSQRSLETLAGNVFAREGYMGQAFLYAEGLHGQRTSEPGSPVISQDVAGIVPILRPDNISEAEAKKLDAETQFAAARDIMRPIMERDLADLKAGKSLPQYAGREQAAIERLETSLAAMDRTGVGGVFAPYESAYGSGGRQILDESQGDAVELATKSLVYQTELNKKSARELGGDKTASKLARTIANIVSGRSRTTASGPAPAPAVAPIASPAPVAPAGTAATSAPVAPVEVVAPSVAPASVPPIAPRAGVAGWKGTGLRGRTSSKGWSSVERPLSDRAVLAGRRVGAIATSREGLLDLAYMSSMDEDDPGRRAARMDELLAEDSLALSPEERERVLAGEHPLGAEREVEVWEDFAKASRTAMSEKSASLSASRWASVRTSAFRWSTPPTGRGRRAGSPPSPPVAPAGAPAASAPVAPAASAGSGAASASGGAGGPVGPGGPGTPPIAPEAPGAGGGAGGSGGGGGGSGGGPGGPFDPRWGGRPGGGAAYFYDSSISQKMLHESRAAMDILKKYGDQMGELAKKVEPLTVQERKRLETLTKQIGILEKMDQRVSAQREDSLTPEGKEALKILGGRRAATSDERNLLARLGYREGRATGDYEAALTRLAKDKAEDAFTAGPSLRDQLDDEQRQAYVLDIMTKGGMSGRRARSDPKNAWIYQEGFDIGVPLRGEKPMRAIGGFMRSAGHMNRTMWATAHIGYQIIDPLMRAAQQYEEIAATRQQALMQGGDLSYADFMGGAYGDIMRRQASFARMQYEAGRQVYNTYIPRVTGIASEALGRTQGALASIGAPFVAGSMLGSALGGPALGGILGGAGFLLGSAAWLGTAAQDTTGLASTGGQLVRNIANMGIKYPSPTPGLYDTSHRLLGGYRTLIDDPFGSLALATNYLFSGFQVSPKLREATEYAALQQGATHFAGGAPWAGRASPDEWVANANRRNPQLPTGAAWTALQEGFIRNLGATGIPEEQALSLWGFSRRYLRDQPLWNPTLQGMTSLAALGAENVPQMAMLANASMGRSAASWQGVSGEAQAATSYLQGTGKTGVELIAETLRYTEGAQRNAQVNAARSLAGMSLRRPEYAASFPWRDNTFFMNMYDEADVATSGMRLASYSMYQANAGGAFKGGLVSLLNSAHAAEQAGRFTDAAGYRYRASTFKSGFEQGFQTFTGYTDYGMDPSRAVALLTAFAGMNPDQQRLTGRIASGDRLALAQNWQRLGSIRYQTIEPSTGMPAFWQNVSGAELAELDRYGSNTPSAQGGFDMWRLSPTEAALGERGWQASILQGQRAYEWNQIRHQQQQFAIRRNLTFGQAPVLGPTGMTVSTGGFGNVGGMMQLDQPFQAGTGQTLWELEDLGVLLGREQQQFGLRQQRAGLGISAAQLRTQVTQFQENLGLQRRQFEYGIGYQRQQFGFQEQALGLQASQFGENYGLQQRQFQYQTGYQRAQIDFERGVQLRQRQWSYEDLAFDRSIAEVQYGFSMRDYDRNIRYARGRERIDLLRHKSDETILFSMQQGRRDVMEGRLDQQAKWEDERYKRQKDYFESNTKFQKEQLELSKKHFEQNRALEIERFNAAKANFEKLNEFQREQFSLQEKHFNQNIEFERARLGLALEALNKEAAWLKRQWALEDQRRLIERQMQLDANKREKDLQDQMIETKLMTDKFTDALTVGRDLLGEWSAHLEVLTKNGGLADQAVIKLTGAVGSLATAAGTAAGTVATATGTITTAASQVKTAVNNSAILQSGAGMIGGRADGGYAGGVPLVTGFARGGYTGDGMKFQAAGVVHKGEWVVPTQGSLVVRGDNQGTIEVLNRILAVLMRIETMKPNVSINNITSTIPANQFAGMTLKDLAFAQVKR